MSLRFALLGLTAALPSTGYELTRLFDASLAHAWHASHSQIYPELRKLEEEGLVEVVSEGARGSRTFAATDAGREALRVWLVEGMPSRKVRDEGALRLFLTSLLEPADRKAVLERELAVVEEHVRTLRALAERSDELAKQDRPTGFRPMIDLGLRITPVTAEWLRDQIEAADR